MSNPLDNYMTTQEAAAAIGIEVPTLMARIRKGKIKVQRKGWIVLIHKDEVKRAKKVEEQKDAKAATKDMEKPAR